MIAYTGELQRIHIARAFHAIHPAVIENAEYCIGSLPPTLWSVHFLL